MYKERHSRDFRNNAAYKEGRQVRDTRTQRAMTRGSRFGQAAAEEQWKTRESEALHTLHAAGVRVPLPVMFYEGVLLMEAVVDAEGRPAERLIDAAVPRERGAEFYADLCQQMVKMLTCDLIHGDLSPYNVLLAWNGPTVIDFPQVVGAAHNSRAEFFFQRDYQTIRRFFASLDPALHGRGDDGREIWRAYERRELTSDFVPTGRLQETNRSREPQAGRGPRSSHAGHRTPPHDPMSPQGHRGQASRQASRQAPRPVSRQAGLAAVNAAPHRGGAAPSSAEPRPPSPRNGPSQPSSASSPGPHGGSRRSRRRRRRSH